MKLYELNPQKESRVFVKHRGIPKKYFLLIKKKREMERKQNSKDLNINLQSGLKFALDYLKYRGVEDATLNEVFRVAEIIAEFTLLEKNQDFKVTLKNADKWISERTKIKING